MGRVQVRAMLGPGRLIRGTVGSTEAISSESSAACPHGGTHAGSAVPSLGGTGSSCAAVVNSLNRRGALVRGQRTITRQG